MTRLRDALSRGGRSILARPGRTALTAFGIGLGVAALLQLVGPSEPGAPGQRRAPARIPRLMVSNGERASLASVHLATPERVRRAGLVTLEGRSLADLDLRDARRVAVIGAGVRAELFGLGTALLKTIEIGATRFTVVGVLGTRAPGSVAGAGFDADHAVLLPEGSSPVSLAGVVPLPGGSPPGSGAAARRAPGRDTASLLGPVAAVSLLLGGAALASAMLATVVERSREIALRRVLGATRGELFGELLLESILVSTLGGLAGIAAGLAHGPGAAQALGPASAWAVPAALALAALVGAAAGLGPALRAARLDPLDALPGGPGAT